MIWREPICPQSILLNLSKTEGDTYFKNSYGHWITWACISMDFYKSFSKTNYSGSFKVYLSNNYG